MRAFLQQKISIAPDVLMQEISGESVLLDLKSESYFGLDEVGTRIWRLIEEHGALQAVFDRLLDEYQVEPGTLERDLAGLVDRMVAAGLLQWREEHEQGA